MATKTVKKTIAKSGGSGKTPAPLAPRSSNRPIRVPKTAEIVSDSIRQRIISGELQEGDSLPPESQLMEDFSISRPTLREAFRILEAEQLISVVRGSRTGARVHLPHVESVSRYASYVLQASGTTVADIYEARLAIEPYIARQLARAQPKEEIVRLRAEADRLGALVEAEKFPEFMVGLAEFHRILVESGGNETLHFLTRILQDVIEKYQVRYLSINPRDPAKQKKNSLSGVRSFHKLIDLIEAGEVDKSEEHWRLHLKNANKTWAIDQSLRSVLTPQN